MGRQDTTRSDVFRLLAACFCLPDRDALLEERVPDRLAERLKAAGGLPHALRAAESEQLRLEYTRLFVGPHALPAPPWGSLYLEDRNEVMGNSTFGVQAAYEAEGLAVDREAAQPPDHISSELEFLHVLHWKGETERAEDFRRTWMAPWVPAFCERIRAATEEPWFVLLADALEEAVA